jgi:hypothetical protein
LPRLEEHEVSARSERAAAGWQREPLTASAEESEGWTSVKMKAAVLWEPHTDWGIEDVDLDPLLSTTSGQSTVLSLNVLRSTGLSDISRGLPRQGKAPRSQASVAQGLRRTLLR